MAESQRRTAHSVLAMDHKDELLALAVDFSRGSLTAREFERAFLDQRRRSRGLPFGRRAKLHDERCSP